MRGNKETILNSNNDTIAIICSVVLPVGWRHNHLVEFGCDGGAGCGEFLMVSWKPCGIREGDTTSAYAIFCAPVQNVWRGRFNNFVLFFRSYFPHRTKDVCAQITSKQALVCLWMGICSAVFSRQSSLASSSTHSAGAAHSRIPTDPLNNLKAVIQTPHKQRKNNKKIANKFCKLIPNINMYTLCMCG